MTNRNPLSSRIIAVIAFLLAPAWTLAQSDGEDQLQTLDCVINPSEIADLGSAVPGVLSAVQVERSDLIQAGDIIAELESGVELATLDLARTRAGLTAEVDLRRVNAAFGRRQQKRNQGLFQRKALSQNDMDQRETEARMAQIELRQAKDNQQLAKLELYRAEEILQRRTIRSPFTGVVMERFKTVGEYVEDQPVARVAQIDPLHVEVIVPVEFLGKIKPGMQAEVWTDVVDTTWQAEVSLVDRVADAASGTYVARLALPNPDYRIPAGLQCSLKFVEQADQPIAAEREAPEPEVVAAIEPRELRPITDPSPHQEIPPVVQVEAPSQPSAVVEETTPEPAPQLPEAVLETVPAETVAATAQSETDAEASQAAIAEQPTKVLPECRWAGPFEDEATARAHTGALQEAGFEVGMEKRAIRKAVGYQVVTRPVAARDKAQELAAALRGAGVTDLYVPKRIHRQSRISLGLYNVKRVAEERVAELKEKGFDAVLVPWRKKTTQFLLAVHGVAEAESAELLAALPVPANDLVPASGTCAHLASR